MKGEIADMRSRFVLIVGLCVLAVCATLYAGARPSDADNSICQRYQIQILGSGGIDGQPQTMSVYGYEESINGGNENLIVECDADGNPTGRAFEYGTQVGATIQRTEVDAYSLDPNETHKLYSVQCLPAILYKGDTPLEPSWADTGGAQLIVYCPYSTLQNNWQWMVYQFTNDDPWPVVAHVKETLGNCGETWNGDEPFAASQTKYLKLDLNSNLVGQNIAQQLWTWAEIHLNQDPLAPPTPPPDGYSGPPYPNYTTDPEADDHSSICWTADGWQGLTILPWEGTGDYFSSDDFWAYEQGFTQVPTWVPNPGEDPHWGQIQYDVVPSSILVKTPGFSVSSMPGNLSYAIVSADNLPGMPKIIPGGLGVFQTAQPASGQYATAYSWEKYSYQYVSAGIFSSLSSWWNFVYSQWPNLTNISGSTYWGTFYTEKNGGNIVSWELSGENVEYILYSAGAMSSGVDVGEEASCTCPADGQWYLFSTGDSKAPYVREESTPGYVLLTGSYDQITAVTKSQNWNVYTLGYAGCTVQQHIEVSNPGSAPVTFYLAQGEDVELNNSVLVAPNADDQGTVTIPAGQSVWLTSSFGMPQKTYYGGGYVAPLSWYNYIEPPNGEDYQALASDFGVGSCRPITGRVYAWTATGIKNTCVAYDWGGYWIDDGGEGDIEVFLGDNNCNPGLCGGLVYDGAFQGGLDSDVDAKIRSIQNNGYATWTAQGVIEGVFDGSLVYYIKAY